jgi:hypothetical protein
MKIANELSIIILFIKKKKNIKVTKSDLIAIINFL